MRWALHTAVPAIGPEFRLQLEKSRDAYLTSNFVIAVDPSNPSRQLRHEKYEAVKAYMDLIIESACKLAEAETMPVHCSMSGTVHPSPEPGETGNSVSITVQVAAREAVVVAPKQKPKKDEAKSFETGPVK